MNECANDRDQQHEDHRELIELEGHVGLEVSDKDPREQRLLNRAFFSGPIEEAEEHQHTEHGRGRDRQNPEVRPPRVGASPTEQQHDCAGQWQRDEQPNQ